ncbi:hypothetical protein [Endozoicomonas sp. 4G]|uniref:hypothetical protein n=1 Tax=Endozoicomonas sp. 4G TaxID=2872754 RepID=UPI002078BE40|nr:hypothetical protein [Endozoicomonas sp. 4G]
MSHESSDQHTPEPPHINERKTERRPWFFQRWYRSYIGKKGAASPQNPDLNPDEEEKQSHYLGILKGLPGKAAGALANLPGAGYEKAASKLDNFVSRQAGIEITHEDEKGQWRSLLYDLLCSYTGVVVNGEQTPFNFNEILIKNGEDLPVRVTALNFDSKRVVQASASYLINGQATENHFQVGDLSCTVEIPLADRPPLTLHFKLENTTLSVATDMSIAQLLKNTFVASSQDRTAVQLSAERVEVRYENLDTYEELTTVPAPSVESDCLVGFERGKVTMEGVRFCKPLDLLEASPKQTSILVFDSLKFTNESARPALVEVKSVKVQHLDDAHNGTFASSLTIHPKTIRNMPYIGWLLAPLFSRPVHLEVVAFMQHGEIRIKDLKRGISVSGGRLTSWLVKKALTARQTRLVPHEASTALQIGWPLTFVACQVDLPGLLPGKPASRAEYQDQVTFEQLHQRPTHDPSIADPSPLDDTSLEELPSRHHLHLEALDQEEGVLIIPDTFSRILSEIASGDQALAQPLRMVPRLLETRCIEATKGDEAACRALLRFVRDQEKFQHESDCMIALQAIPAAFFVKEAAKADDETWLWLESVAHRLIAVDGEKAFELYKQLLKRKDIENASELVTDIEWLIHLAKNLPTNTPEEKALAFRLAEFTYKSNPEKAEDIIKLLIRWSQNKLYKNSQMRTFIEDLISHHPYFTDPHHLVSLLNLLDRSHPDIVAHALAHFPIQTLLQNFQVHDNIRAHNTLGFLKELLIRHGLFKEAAELLIESGNHRQAARMLDLGIRQGNPSALKVMLELAVRDQLPEDITLEKEMRRLRHLMENPTTSEAMSEAAMSILADVMKQKPHPELAEIFTEGVLMAEEKKAYFVKAVNSLFNLQDGEAVTLSDRLQTLNQIEEYLKAARTDESAYLNKPLILKQIQDANQQVDRVMKLLIKVRGPVEPNLLAALISASQAEADIETEEDDDVFFDAEDNFFDPVIDEASATLNEHTATANNEENETTIASTDHTDHQEEEAFLSRSLPSYTSLLGQPVFSRPSSEFLDPALRKVWASILGMRVK